MNRHTTAGFPRQSADFPERTSFEPSIRGKGSKGGKGKARSSSQNNLVASQPNSKGLSLPPIKQGGAAQRASYNVSDPDQLLFLGHAAEAKSAPLAGSHPAFTQPRSSEVVLGASTSPGSPKIADKLYGELSTEVRPWGKKATTPPLR